MRPEAIVIGAGPAGLSSALGLLRGGFRLADFNRRQQACDDARVVFH